MINTSKTQHFRKSLAFLFVVYWTALVIWQNFGGTAARTNIDVVIKIALLLYFVFFYIQRYKKMSAKILVIFFLGVILLFTAIEIETFSLSMVISYVYPILFLAMVYGVGDSFVITKKHFLVFCNWIIAVTLYAALYAMIFCWDQFTGALSLSSAYGNELCSFFVSNHEYGLYLLSAIVSCFLCLRFTHAISLKRRIYYIVALGIFFINLVLTFSRTTMLSLAVFIAIFVLFGKGSLKKWFIFLTIVGAVVVFITPQLSNFVFSIVLKGNTTAGRDVLYNAAFDYYTNGTIFEKIFGFGISNTRNFFENTYAHASVHNAYLQILLYYGAFGLTAMVLFLFSQFIACIKFIKKDRYLGTVFLGLVISASAMMITNTTIVFTSPIDSYFMTMFMFVVPKYVRNAVHKGVFVESVDIENKESVWGECRLP